MTDQQLVFFARCLHEQQKILMEAGAYCSAVATSDKIFMIDKKLLRWQYELPDKFSVNCLFCTEHIDAAIEHAENRIESLRQLCAEAAVNGANREQLEQFESQIDASWAFCDALGEALLLLENTAAQ